MEEPSMVVDAIVRACTDSHLEMPVDPKAHASNLSHHLFPNLTERLLANIADSEVKKAWEAPATTGNLHKPMQEGATVDGGIRERMKQEDSEASPAGS